MWALIHGPMGNHVSNSQFRSIVGGGHFSSDDSLPKESWHRRALFGLSLPSAILSIFLSSSRSLSIRSISLSQVVDILQRVVIHNGVLQEAYASNMNGTLLFEEDKNWKTALKNFLSASAVYEELGKYGDMENQILCREHVEELEPSIRYCRHKIGESNLKTSDLLQIGEMEGPALDLFKSKLEVSISEARTQQAASLTEFHWLGHKYPISNANTRVSILKGLQMSPDFPLVLTMKSIDNFCILLALFLITTYKLPLSLSTEVGTASPLKWMIFNKSSV